MTSESNRPVVRTRTCWKLCDPRIAPSPDLAEHSLRRGGHSARRLQKPEQIGPHIHECSDTGSAVRRRIPRNQREWLLLAIETLFDTRGWANDELCRSSGNVHSRMRIVSGVSCRGDQGGYREAVKVTAHINTLRHYPRLPRNAQ
jgi:hypothetical protein